MTVQVMTFWFIAQLLRSSCQASSLFFFLKTSTSQQKNLENLHTAPEEKFLHHKFVSPLSEHEKKRFKARQSKINKNNNEKKRNKWETSTPRKDSWVGSQVVLEARLLRGFIQLSQVVNFYSKDYILAAARLSKQITIAALADNNQRWSQKEALTIFWMDRAELRVCWAHFWRNEVRSMRWCISPGWIELICIRWAEIKAVVMMTVAVVVNVTAIGSTVVWMVVEWRHVMWWHLIQRERTGRNVLSHLMTVLCWRDGCLCWWCRCRRLGNCIDVNVCSARCIVVRLRNHKIGTADQGRWIWRGNSQANHHRIWHESFLLNYSVEKRRRQRRKTCSSLFLHFLKNYFNFVDVQAQTSLLVLQAHSHTENPPF